METAPEVPVAMGLTLALASVLDDWEPRQKTVKVTLTMTKEQCRELWALLASARSEEVGDS